MRLCSGLTFFQFLLTTLLFLSFQGSVRGADITWNGATSDDWFTAANWNGNVTPDSIDTAIISGSTDSVQFGSAVLIDALTMSDGLLNGMTTTFEATGLSIFQGGGITGTADHTFGTDGSSGSGLQWSSGDLTSTGTVNVFDTFVWSGGTLNLSNSESSGTLFLKVETGGVTNEVTWESGHIAGEGLAIADGGQVNVTGTKTRTISGTGLQNAGVIVFNDAPQVDLGDSSSSTNILNTSTGSIEFNGTTAIKDASTAQTSTIFNQGKITNNTGSDETVIDTNILQSGSGEIVVQSGSLALSGGGSFGTGTTTKIEGAPDVVLTAASVSNPRIELRNSQYSFDEGSSLENQNIDGEISITTGADVLVAGTFDNQGSTIVTDNSTLVLANESSTSNFLAIDNGSTVQLSGTHTIHGGEWTDGTIRGFTTVLPDLPITAAATASPTPVTYGQTILQAGSETPNTLTLSTSEDKILIDHELVNNDQVVQSEGTLQLNNSRIINNGSWTMSDANITSDAVSVFDNNGSVDVQNVEVGSSITAYYNSTDGDLSIEDGNFTLSGGGNLDEGSTVNVGSAESSNFTSLVFNNGDYTFAGNPSSYSTLNGTSNSSIELNGSTVLMSGKLTTDGVLYVDNGSTLTIDLVPDGGAASAATLQLGSSPDTALTANNATSTFSKIDGKGSLQIQGGSWIEGEIAGDGQEFGPFTVNGSPDIPVINDDIITARNYSTGSLFIGGSGEKRLTNRTMENFGNIHQESSTLQLTGAAIENYGQWSFSTGSYITDSGESSFTNFGEIYTSSSVLSINSDFTPAGVSGVTITPDFVNSGRVYANGDLLVFDGSYSQQPANLDTEGGYDVDESQETSVANGATIVFNQGATFSSGRIIGDGEIAGNLTVSNTEIEPFSSFANAATTAASDFTSQNAILGYGGAIHFAGNVDLDSTAQVTLKIFDAPSEESNDAYDQITTSGTFNINDATLNIESPNDVASLLTSSDFFPILQAANGGEFIGLFAGLTDGSLVDIYDLNDNLLGQFNIFYDQFEIGLTNFQPVPEPETYALLTIGLGVIAWSVRRKRNAAAV